MAKASTASERSLNAEPSRPRRAALALLGGAWALLSLPLVAADWSWPWVATLSRAEPWSSVRAAVDDPYVVFGALAALSFLAIGIALLPDLRRAGWGGIVMLVAILAGTLVSPLSYLGTPESSPLHWLWGSEGPLLVAVGLAGVLAAITAHGWPLTLRLLLGVTLLVLVAGTLALGYYPHGPLLALGIEAAVLILGASRASEPTPASVDGAAVPA